MTHFTTPLNDNDDIQPEEPTDFDDEPVDPWPSDHTTLEDAEDDDWDQLPSAS